MPELPIDHDTLFKELITTLFFEFLEFFAPQIAAAIDRNSAEFLDKEMLSDLVLGDENEVDILVKVKIAGQESFVLIHIENQSSSRSNFRARMFDYFTRIRAKFSLPVYPIALFSFDKPLREEPNTYTETTFGLQVLRFEFRSIQLNRLKWRDYAGSNNPMATALMVKMQVAPEDHYKIRMESIRLFATLKLDARKQQTIDRFMRNYLRLTAEDMILLRREIEKTMPEAKQRKYLEVMNEWEELGKMIGLEQGIALGTEQGIALGTEQGIALGTEQGIVLGTEKGIETGLREGEARMILRLLRRKFGEIDENFQYSIFSLSTGELENLAEALLDFQTLENLHLWLTENTHNVG